MTVCLPWNEVFKTYKKAGTKIKVLLYWSLFNKPNYQGGIADKMGKIQTALPSTVTDARAIGQALKEMEECNLISRINENEIGLFGIKDSRENIKYFQALSFFYLDPFCIKTPKSKGKVIEDHYEEYINYIKERIPAPLLNYRQIYSFPDSSLDSEYFPMPFFAFDSLNKNCSVIPAQRIVQYYSSTSEKFMKAIISHGMNFLSLFELIKKSFEEALRIVKFYSSDLNEQFKLIDEFQEPDSFLILSPEKVISDITKILKIRNTSDVAEFRRSLQSIRFEVIQEYNILEWFGRDKIFPRDGKGKPQYAGIYSDLKLNHHWDFLESHIFNVIKWVEKQLELYREVTEQELTFNDESLRFERKKH